MNTNRLLYFSVNGETISAFVRYVESCRYNYKHSFRIINPEEAFKHSSDLVFFLDGMADVSGLYVIIDYCSLSHPKSGGYFDSEWRSADIIRRAILKYPEVFFLFEETASEQYFGEQQKRCDYDFTHFLLKRKRVNEKDGSLYVGQDVTRKEYHHFKAEKDKVPFIAFLNQRNNLFDGTNLRYAIKKFIYSDLSVNKENFEKIQQSRSENLALCIEEEQSQSRFISYALFANGFRVLPIQSAHELLSINKSTGLNQTGALLPKVVFRDIDLQFSDAAERGELGSMAEVEKVKKDKNSIHKQINLVDIIRGIKSCHKKPNEEKVEGLVNIEYEDKWLSLSDDNPFWSNLCKIRTFFITKGVTRLKVKTKNDLYSCFKDAVAEQQLPGMYKPVTGLYHSFQQFDEVKSRYKEISFGESDKPMDTTREGHDHGVPLDIYDLVKGMIKRAMCYQNEGQHILAAIISQDAMEVLNGFHQSLMLKAYYIHSVSENAITMKLIGGDEKWLEADTVFRVQKIESEVNYFLKRLDNDSNDRVKYSINILNQIFSDCRQFCKSKEHFLSEEVFVAAMANLNEGYTPTSAVRKVKDSISKAWASFWGKSTRKADE